MTSCSYIRALMYMFCFTEVIEVSSAGCQADSAYGTCMQHALCLQHLQEAAEFSCVRVHAWVGTTVSV